MNDEITEIERQIKELENRLKILTTEGEMERLKSFEGLFYRSGSVYFSFRDVTESGLKTLSFTAAVLDGWYKRTFLDEEDVQSFIEYGERLSQEAWSEALADFWQKARTTLEGNL